MSGQYLTAVFELRPSRRKAAAMERVRSAAEGVFWNIIDASKDHADAIAGIEDKKLRREAWMVEQREIYRRVRTEAGKKVSSQVADGIVRDVTMAISSYVELRAAGHEAEWPAKVTVTEADYVGAIDLFLSASTEDHEDEASAAMGKLSRLPGPRPFVMSRGEDAKLIRQGPTGSIAVVLNIGRATDPRAKVATIKAGIDATTGEVTKSGKSEAKIIVPVSCSKWHEQKFLSGKATLRSSLIVREGDRWFMCAQFEMAIAKQPTMTGARLGVDRGVVNPIATAVVRQDGSVITAADPMGAEIGKIIRDAEAKKRAEQKRRGITSRKHVQRVDNALHQLANSIVSDAKAFGAQVVFEKLGGLKQSIVTKREKGARKGGWRKVMKAAQLGKLETIVGYKLKLAGLPAVREVVAGGTSITCPACGLRDPKNRKTQAGFLCVGCGFGGNADTVAGVNCARRDIAMKGIKKGDKLAPLEQDMVARLRLRGDCGLGPLVDDYAAASGFVWVRASAATANEELSRSLTVAAGQNDTFVVQNPTIRVFAERDNANSGHHRPNSGSPKRRKVSTHQQLTLDGLW